MNEERRGEPDSLNQLSRRRFLGGIAAASATVVVFGASFYQLWKMGMDIWEGSLAKLAIPTSNGYIIFDPALCTGCEACEVVCTTFNYGKSNLNLSRIQILRDPFRPSYDNFNPMPCLQCEDPHCLPVCPVAALRIDAVSGTNARVIDETECIGCKRCIEACSAKHGDPRIRFNEERKTALKCHLCYGEPRCVKYCPNSALRYVSKIPVDASGGGDIRQVVFQDERQRDIPRRMLR